MKNKKQKDFNKEDFEAWLSDNGMAIGIYTAIVILIVLAIVGQIYWM